MSSVEQFLTTIASFNSDDAWYDCGADEATRILRVFDHNDWEELSTALPSLSNEQLQRIAYALVDGDPDAACPLLIKIIGFENIETALGACDSLRAILEPLRKKIPVSTLTSDYILNLAKTAPEPWKTSCEGLLKHLSLL